LTQFYSRWSQKTKPQKNNEAKNKKAQETKPKNKQPADTKSQVSKKSKTKKDKKPSDTKSQISKRSKITKAGSNRSIGSDLNIKLVESVLPIPELHIQEDSDDCLEGNFHYEKPKEDEERYTAPADLSQVPYADKYFAYAACAVKKPKAEMTEKQRENIQKLKESQYTEHPEYKKIDEQYKKNRQYEYEKKTGKVSAYLDDLHGNSALLITNPYRTQKPEMINNPYRPAKEYIEIGNTKHRSPKRNYEGYVKPTTKGCHDSYAPEEYVNNHEERNRLPSMSRYEQLLEKELEVAKLEFHYGSGSSPARHRAYSPVHDVQGDEIEYANSPLSQYLETKGISSGNVCDQEGLNRNTIHEVEKYFAGKKDYVRKSQQNTGVKKKVPGDKIVASKKNITPPPEKLKKKKAGTGGFTTVIPKKDRPLLVEKKIQTPQVEKTPVSEKKVKTPPKKIIKQPILLLHGKRLKTPPVEEDVDWSQMEKKHALQKQKKTETPQKTETPHVEEEVDWSQIHKKCAPQNQKKTKTP